MGLGSSRTFLNSVNLFTTTAIFLVAASAFANPETKISSCDRLYQQRTNLQHAKQALRCYTAVMRETRETNAPLFREAAEFAAQTALWIYHEGAGANRTYAVFIGTEIAHEAHRVIGASGIGPYWSAVFQILKCNLVDGALPYCFYTSKKKIFSDLDAARHAEPDLHGAGPSRILSVLYRELPKLAGGDLELAEKFMREAINSMPNFSSNVIESAKLALRQKNKALSRRLLSDFLAHPCRTMDPSRVPECERDRETASKMLRKMEFSNERATP